MTEEQQVWGRLIPTDWRHVEKYRYRSLEPLTIEHVERTLKLPTYREWYDQGREGACVGFASSWMMSILNRQRYDARWLWNRAKEVDEWPDTNPGDNNGTSVRAAMDILRQLGHVRAFRGKVFPPSLQEGINENRWATTIDEMRTCIANGMPIVFGINWYTNFDAPLKKGGQWWIGLGDLGRIRGGHAVCIYRASDRLQAFGIVNNWGNRYPLVLMPYSIAEQLLNANGESTMVTDRV